MDIGKKWAALRVRASEEDALALAKFLNKHYIETKVEKDESYLMPMWAVLVPKPIGKSLKNSKAGMMAEKFEAYEVYAKKGGYSGDF